ncbi:MAG: DUF1743 domain-containing protein [Candidatus Methanomethylophilaceae archaeon]|nr:DUF1743 domain-containing protein [Candidatus Methanomethylophilaceae archaeon]
MFVAVDDTDSMRGNCTTFLATEIIRELSSDFDLIGNPRLIRLNPAVPWKTRGNGSLVMRFGKGRGQRHLIGEIDGKELFCFDESDDFEYDRDKVLSRLIPLVNRYHESDADPGLFISDERPDESFYFRGLFTIMKVDDVLDELKKIKASIFTIGCGRGLIGATCGLSWCPDDYTYELLAYRMPDKWGTERYVEPSTIREMDFTYETTFNSWEERTHKVAMVPATPCPVLYGLRGDDMEDLIPASFMIKSERKYRWVIFLTNQGTDDHIITQYEEMRPNASYLVQGKVVSNARHIKGGHTFIDIETKCGIVTCGAYEPSKEFRYAFDRLIPGDFIEVMGEFREEPATLNVEKLHVISIVPDIQKTSNPRCPVCGKRMTSRGKDQGFRCRACHTKTKEFGTEERTRWIVPGWYEPPTAARRHLSKPLKRMGLEQPCEFVNSRIQ